MARAEYRALRTLTINGVIGYHEGYDVYADVVEAQGWVVGEDVESSGLQLLEQPAKNASRSAWASYAIDQGMDPAKVDGMRQSDFVAHYTEVAEVDDGEAAGSEGSVQADH